MIGRDRNQLCTTCGKKMKNCTCHVLMGWMLAIVVVIIAAIATIVIALRDNASTSRDASASDEDVVDPLVPPRSKMFTETIKLVPHLPRVSKSQFTEALGVMLSVTDAPALQTEDDRDIMAMVREYASGRQVLHLVWQARKLDGAPNSNKVTRMAYTCTGDKYSVNPEIQTSTALLASSLYHEIMHRVECKREMRAFGLTEHEDMLGYIDPDACRDEEPAYKAQVRFALALHEKGLFPTQFSAEERGDIGLVQRVRAAWDALLQNRFCSWYTAYVNRE